MKELRYEIINTIHGLTERYIVVHDDGTEEVTSERQLDTDNMLGVYNVGMSGRKVKINREE